MVRRSTKTKENKIEVHKNVMVKTEIIESRDDKTLCKVKYNEDYKNLSTLVWFNNEHLKKIKNDYYLVGEVLEIRDSDIEVIFTNGSILFTLTFNKNIVKGE